MALTTNLAREKYTGNGSTRIFYFHFAVWNTSEVKVYTGNNTSETQVLTGITITLTGQPGGAGTKASGGYVTFTTAPASGVKIAIVRSMPFIQEDVYTSGSRFDAKEVEDRLDEDCAERQELLDKVTRSIKVPGTSDLTPEQFSQSLLDASQTAVQKAAEAAASASSANNSAVSANNSKNAAANSATSAGNSAAAAATSAGNASVSETNAGNSATSAGNSAAAAATSKTDACDCAETSRKWAVGTTAEQPAGSSKYWAELAKTIMGNHPSIIRWVRTTVPFQTVYTLDTPDPTSSNAAKYLVFYGTDLLDVTDYDINSSATPKTITLRESPQESLTLTVCYVAEAMVEIDVVAIGTIFSIIGCEDAYVPSGAVPCDGAEYAKLQFPDLYTFLTQATPFLKTCSYTDYATEIATYGSCAKWGLDTANEKFKVPTIPDGTFLQQASTAAETGKSYTAGLPNITGGYGSNNTRNDYYGNVSGAIQKDASKTTTQYINVTANTATSNNTGFNFDASRSSPIYGGSTTVQPKSVTVRYFVQVANASVNQSTMDWSAWASGLGGKLNKDFTNVVPGSPINPTGTLIWVAQATAPTGYLACNGAAISRTTYAALFTAIGTNYGAGDGSSTFNLPNLIDRVAWGGTPSTTSANNYIAAGVPNITGETEIFRYGCQYFQGQTGAFTILRNANISINPVDHTRTDIGSQEVFNASNGELHGSVYRNDVYGKSETVQPPATVLLPCIKI